MGRQRGRRSKENNGSVHLQSPVHPHQILSICPANLTMYASATQGPSPRMPRSKRRSRLVCTLCHSKKVTVHPALRRLFCCRGVPEDTDTLPLTAVEPLLPKLRPSAISSRTPRLHARGALTPGLRRNAGEFAKHPPWSQSPHRKSLGCATYELTPCLCVFFFACAQHTAV